MTICATCEVDKPDEAFTPRNLRVGGGIGKCRECERAYRISVGHTKPPGWERKTADMAAYQRAYRLAHPEKMRQLDRENKAKSRRKNPERWLAKSRRRYERKMREKHGQDWQPKPRLTPAERLAAKRASRRRKHLSIKSRHPEKYYARRALRRAVKSGKLIRQPCENCGEPKSHGHHPDYSKPLEVIWLCDPCHRAVHKLANADCA